MTATQPIVVALGPRVSPAEVPLLCERVRAALEHSGADELICDAAAVSEPNLAAVDALARLRITTRTAGARMRVRDPSTRLCELLLLVGLVEVLGEVEHREPAVGVQEVGDLDDPSP
ncbi:STAS domain-containing protein [Streptomyces apocyni]|uniref:STAS domain-containing protein n=1 Tax=Streptomyces apocyni TaxID=2654677 RepID=UPI001E4F1C2C|nr:STAS domain-containing protein [Streptomyces apocyni]